MTIRYSSLAAAVRSTRTFTFSFAAWPPASSLAVILIVTIVNLYGQEPFDGPDHEVVIDDAADRSPAIYASGYVLQYARSLLARRPDAVLVTNLKDGKRETVPFWIDGAERIQIEAATAQRSGRLLIAGAFVPSAQPDTTRNFVFEVDRTGDVRARYDTASYTVERLCASDDGSFWSLGQVWADEPRGGASYDLIRHYSPDGKLYGSYLPRSVLPQGIRLNYHNFPKGVNWAFLSCAGATAVAYLGRSNSPGFLWYEITDRGVRQAIVRNPNFVKPSGVIVAADRTTYATFAAGVSSEGYPGLYKLTFSPEDAPHWEVVESGKPLIALGGGGPELVYVIAPLLGGRVKVYRRTL